MALAAKAQTKADEEAVRGLVDAWPGTTDTNWQKIKVGDVDFATAATTYLRGRAGFEKFPV